MSKTVSTQDEKKGVNYFALLVGFFKMNLYGFVILKDYFTYQKLAKMVPSENFLKETASKHKKAAIAYIIAHALILPAPIYLVSQISHTENVDSLLRKTKVGKNLYAKFKPLRKVDDTISQYVSTFQKRKKGRNMILISLSVLALHSVFFSAIISFHPVRGEYRSDELKKALIDEGLHQENDGRLCMALPCGYYIDIAGHGAKEIATRESLWKRMSVTIEDLRQYETPGKNTRVFFVKKFVLKDKYNFG